MGPAFLQREAGSLRLWMRGEIGGGEASQRSERFLRARARAELRSLSPSSSPALMGGAAVTLLIAGDCGGRPIVRRAAACPGRRSLVCAGPRGACGSGVRRRTRRAAPDWLQRGEARSPVGRAGYAMMGEGRRAVDRARTASRDRAARRRLPAGRESGLK